MSRPPLELEHLTLKDALDLGIQIEEDARDSYVELAGQLRLHHRSDRVAKFFEEMAQMEEAHRAELLAIREARFPGEPLAVRMDDVDAPPAAHVVDVRVKLTLREALEVALDAEQRAQEFFERALINVKDPEAGALFASLREEEVEHRRLMHEQLQRVPSPRGVMLPVEPLQP